MDSKNKTILFLLTSLLLIHNACEGKKVDCRKYLFAPICRGAGAKRDIQKLEPLFEEPRTPRTEFKNENFQNSEWYSENKLPRDNNNIIYDNKLMDTLLEKITRNEEYDTGTNC